MEWKIEHHGDPQQFRIEYVISKPHFKERCFRCQWLGGFVFDKPYVCGAPSVDTEYVDLYFHDGDCATLYVRYGHDLEEREGLRFSVVKKMVNERKELESCKEQEYFPAFEEAYRRVVQKIAVLSKEDPRANV